MKRSKALIGVDVWWAFMSDKRLTVNIVQKYLNSKDNGELKRSHGMFLTGVNGNNEQLWCWISTTYFRGLFSLVTTSKTLLTWRLWGWTATAWLTWESQRRSSTYPLCWTCSCPTISSPPSPWLALTWSTCTSTITTLRVSRLRNATHNWQMWISDCSVSGWSAMVSWNEMMNWVWLHLGWSTGPSHHVALTLLPFPWWSLRDVF